MPLEDTDLDGTTLGKPSQLAAPTARLNALPFARPVPSQTQAAALTSDQDRRAFMTGLALLPLVAMVGEADAANTNAFVSKLVEKSKADKKTNDAKRFARQKEWAKQYSIELRKQMTDGSVV